MQNSVYKKINTEEEGNFSFAELFIFTLVIVLVAMTFLFRHSVVDGGSMNATLEDGEHVIISDLFYTPRAGDIVVFEDYSLGYSLQKPLIKRVIGVAGDTVRITSFGDVYVNGAKLDEPYVYIDSASYRYSELTYTVSEGCVFVMGDHRNDSLDSRYFGEVPNECILGRLLLRITPIGKFGSVD